jgi:zinc/manganese transport system ATP-binding protein
VTGPFVRLRAAKLSYGERTLWSGLSLAVERGEFVAMLGANGAGKSSLFKVLLGLVPLTAGTSSVLGAPARRGRKDIGYMPQHRGYGPSVPLRARDLVRMGIDGGRLGLGGNRRSNARVDELLEEVGATAYGSAPLGRLSGGEQQRLRVAQAIATDPRVLLCDEPLQSLDLTMQRTVVNLIDRHRRARGAAVLFATHEINPVLSSVDRVLYIVDGTFRFGTPDEVMTSASLSELYRSEVEVIRRGGRLIVVGADDHSQPPHLHPAQNSAPKHVRVGS